MPINSVGFPRTAVRLTLFALLLYVSSSTFLGWWNRDNTTREIDQAYAFVVAHRQVTQHLPCFCGCGKREGHSSLDSCFVNRRDENGRPVAIDPHARTCKICIELALRAANMIRSGHSVEAIRVGIESDFESAAALATPTDPVPK